MNANGARTGAAIMKALGIASDPPVISLTIHLSRDVPTVTVERVLDVGAGDELASALESFMLVEREEG